MFHILTMQCCLAFIAPNKTALTLQVGSSSIQVEMRTADIVRKRLTAAHVSAAVLTRKAGLIDVVLNRTAPSFLPVILTARGIVTFRIVPHGDTYHTSAGRTLKSASIGEDEGGNPILTFYTADPKSFYSFTKHHLNKRLGIFLDDKLLSAPTINGPISDSGEIAVAKGYKNHFPIIAAILSSEPFPVPVKLVTQEH